MEGKTPAFVLRRMERRQLAGKKFNRLTIVRQLLPGKRSLCRCECGTERDFDTYAVTHSGIKSCGCLQRERYDSGGPNLKHGESRPGRWAPEYRAWSLMLTRCCNVHTPSYARYGGRGITVCGEWRNSFEAFLADMGRRPSPEHSIGRKDNDGPYVKWNCEWQTRTEQARNRRTSRFVTAFGRTLTLAGWQDVTNIPAMAIWKRLHRGWTPERAVAERLH